ncbi:uncharacterized protein N7477_005020 [Penicillium maclennaniae]|uniref:uncharacterized protein n=1 Tax=Penicillium maclennaniae TaxID=1343394 RepID=UPI002540C9A2|nr:uncharacterized protein N7477_005020 [Penicillium maclennaniae]KAJ5675086.1 hypothetical protein N7477_005020 [Penicillium maclennaniae]
MASLGRAMRRLTSHPRLDSITDLFSIISAEAPQVNLSHVDTQLNMHQFNGFFEDGSTAADGLRGQSHSMLYSAPMLILSLKDSQGSASVPSHAPTSPELNTEAPTEWSAVGHAAATGKSGRVIHNLQEEIARLTRECNMYRSRAEETQRSNETLKIQVQNMSERVRNLEQVHETNLNSIARKDKKVEELRNELHNERVKRQDADANASKTNQTMQDERESHNREQAKMQEIAKFHETQYEVLVSTTKRDKAELSKRFKTLFAELQTLAQAQKTQHLSFDRLDVIAEQKNREIDNLRETNEKLLARHADYKTLKDDELRGEIERSHANNDSIEATLASIKEVQAQMRWAIQINDMEKQRKYKEKHEEPSK